MTEAMVRSSVGESFAYAKSEFGQVQSGKESAMLIGDDIEDESTLSFNDKLDTACDKSSESTICGSNSDDSVVSELQSTKNLTNIADDVQDSANSTIKSDTSCEDYEYRTTKTTVINRTYNMISQSGVHDMKKVSSYKQHTSSQSVKNENVDKSRVIVQILSSDTKDSTKSQGVFENNSANENQNTHSFRDDVFKILSKPQSTFDFGSDSKEPIEIKDALNVCDSIQTFSSQIESSTKIVRTRRKRSLSSFLFDRGPKLCEIKHVSACLKTASISALRVLHYVLFDKYGLCGSEIQIAKIRRKISHFSGYPFDRNSTHYRKRLNSLVKIPVFMLCEAHEAIFGKTPFLGRTPMVDNLMKFFCDTETYSEILNRIKPDIKPISENEYAVLKKRAKSGPYLVVALKRLCCEDLNGLENEYRLEEVAEQKMLVENENVLKDETGEELPAYILKGPGRKLKHFSAIVKNVEKAKEKEIDLLHYLLYGRRGSISACRRNILEFSGFLECQNEFIAEVEDSLRRMDQADMFELCKILCLRAKTNSRSLRIKKIMEYLQAPFNPFKIKGSRRKEKVSSRNSSRSKVATSESRVLIHPVEVWNEPENAESCDGGYRLRDFRKICTNIECSAPSDLTELNDLLFMKPSDDTEIHDKILNFTRFGFSDSSIHYHYRKTLMFYMGPCIVHKIAKLLDIENWHIISSHEDLSVCILNFLMEKKSPDSPHIRSSLSPSFSKSFMHSSFTDKLGSPENSIPVENSQEQMDQAITHCQESMFISSVSKSSINNDLCSPWDNTYLNADSEKRNDSFSSSASFVEDDSVPLRAFIHHPTDQELKRDIVAIVRNELFNITLGDVVKKVYQLYPRFNLTYRENFIKSETRLMLCEMRQNAVEHIVISCIT